MVGTRVIGVAIAIQCMVTGAHASPWGQPFGAVFATQRLEAYSARNEGRAFDQESATFYGEIGLPRRTTVSTKIGYGSQTLSGPGYEDDRAGLMEADFTVSKRLDRGGDRQVLSLELHHEAGTDLASILAGERVDGRDAASGLGAAWGLSLGRSFVAASGRHLWSSGDDADRIDIDLTAGRRVGEAGLLLLTEVNTTTAVTTDLAPGGRSVDLGTLSASAALPIGRGLRLQGGIGHDIWSRNTDRGTRFFLALWVQR